MESYSEDKRHALTESSALHECWMHRKMYLMLCLVIFILTYAFTYFYPCEFAAQAEIADESMESDLLLGLDNMSAWVKQNMGKNEGIDDPEVYSQVLSSIDFAEEVSKIKLPLRDETYYDHIRDTYTPGLWNRFVMRITGESDKELSVYPLEQIRKHIRHQTSLSYHTTIIQVSDRDPQIAALITDSVVAHLFDRLAKEKKAITLQQFKEVSGFLEEAKNEYDAAQETYSQFLDAHTDISNAKVQSLADALELERDQKFTAYENVFTQYLREEALLHKTSYPFAVLKTASVPLHPYRPQRGVTSVSITIIFLLLYTWYILGKKKFKEGGMISWR